MSAPAEQRGALRALAQESAAELEGSSPPDVMRWAVTTFGSALCIASSMADAVLVDMASRVAPGVPVVFLDTGYHFPETLGTRDAVAATYDVQLLTIQPRQTVAQQDDDFGPMLWKRDPDACCALRKVDPLRRALEPYSAWASGVRRDETPDRGDMPVVAWDAKRQMVKVNPLATWTQADVDTYVAEHDVLQNPLLSEGYGSIGCAPCTRRGDGRAGRWAGATKTECGLHL